MRSFKRGLCSFGQGCSVINKIVLPKLYCEVVETDYYQYVKLICTPVCRQYKFLV